ncbi:MAG: Txe/YoeB family addiction module toxin [Syntrophomonadaceae bacterium]|nr:Txe/YoeB family addiction module toxin [Syntrophomonadaceae bacterium]MDD3897915.1 Txe/YoeB family addiction module toxin [Syntrophomonadaceae bacterium]MDD4561767.1 Txe/YoeB family addiction module toxin [Syntrophomonadaceae bacterium]
MNKIWHDRAWEEYLYWQTQDRKTLKRINNLIKDIERDPFVGIGKPEPLTGDKQGYWSRRIDEVNRIVYSVAEGQLTIVQCGGHYKD